MRSPSWSFSSASRPLCLPQYHVSQACFLSYDCVERSRFLFPDSWLSPSRRHIRFCHANMSTNIFRFEAIESDRSPATESSFLGGRSVCLCRHTISLHTDLFDLAQEYGNSLGCHDFVSLWFGPRCGIACNELMFSCRRFLVVSQV